MVRGRGMIVASNKPTFKSSVSQVKGVLNDRISASLKMIIMISGEGIRGDECKR